MRDAPVESSSEEQINKEKKESFTEEAIAQKQMLSAEKELKEATSKFQEERIEECFVD